MEPSFPLLIGPGAASRPDLFQFVLVQSGALRLLCAGSASSLSCGSLVLLPPGAACRTVREPDCSLRELAFGRSLVDPLALDGSIERVIETLGMTTPRIARLSSSDFQEARALFAILEREVGARKPGYQAMARLKLMEAMLLVLRGQAESQDGRPAAPLRFHPVEALRFIQERCAEQITLAGIAARYGLNPSYFSRLFHHHAGMPFVEYVNRMRIQKSCQLLKRSEAAIVEIALAVGYNNLSHFNRYFRRIMGMSPRDYRSFGKK